MGDRLVQEFMEQLEMERAALRNGKFDRLEKISEKKSELLSKMTRSDLKQDDLRKVKARLIENKNLISSAMRGVSAAKDRLLAMRKVREELAVYDRDGQVFKVETLRPAVEKKA